MYHEKEGGSRVDGTFRISSGTCYVNYFRLCAFQEKYHQNSGELNI